MARIIIRNSSETDEEKIKRLENEKLQLEVALAESIEKQASDKVELQLAIAEVIETISNSSTT